MSPGSASTADGGHDEHRAHLRGSIRRKVALAMLVVALVPLVAVAVVAYRSQLDSAEREAAERLSGIASVQESRVAAFARASLENLGQVSSRTELRRSLRAELVQPAPANTELMNQSLADAASASTTISRIELATVDGIVVASSDGSGLGVDRSTSAAFQAGLAAPEVSHVESTPSGTIGRHAAPVTLDGEQLGVLLVEVNLAPLRELIADFTGLGDTGESALIGQAGAGSFELIGPLRAPDAYTGQAIVRTDQLNPTLGRGAALVDGFYEHATDYRGNAVFAATGPIDAVDGWGLIVKIDRHEALSDARRLGRILLASVLSAVVLVVAAALVLARTLSRPAVDLRNTAIAVSQGDTTKRAVVRGNDEMTLLATEFNRMTDELTAANARLTLTNEQLEEFVYISSHDLKSPLRSIASFGQLLDQQFGDRLDDTGREYVEFIRDGATRMHGVIEDLLQYLRIEKEGHHVEAVDLNKIFQAVVALHNPTIREIDADIHIEVLPSVAGSEALLRQLFDNLIQNALRYHAPERPLCLRISATTDGNDVVTEIADNGLGVPPDRREEAFEVFRRLSAEGPGTGMGLAICRRIARRHGGDVTMADSDLATADAGLTLLVRLPAWGDGQPSERDVASLPTR